MPSTALERLLRPAPADKWELWCTQLGHPVPPDQPVIPMCLAGHRLDGEAPFTATGGCRACWNLDAIARGNAA